MKLRLLILLSLLIVTTWLIWHFGFQEREGSPASYDVETTQSSAAQEGIPEKQAITNESTCHLDQTKLESGDFKPVDQVLNCILTEYMAASARKDSAKILLLDHELRDLIPTLQPIKQHDKWRAFWEKEFPSRYEETIGVLIDDRSIRYDRRLQSRAQSFAEFDQFKQRFEQIRIAYLTIPKTSEKAAIEKLYELDDQLEKLVDEVRNKFDSFAPFPNYPEIGIHHDGGLWYYGTIRLAADKLLPPQGFIDPKTGEKAAVKGDRYSKLKGTLEDIYRAFNSLRLVPEDAEKLYELSEELGKAMEEVHKSYSGARSQIFWEDKYKALGLYIGHYSDELNYGGKLTIDSYKLNPNSRYSEAALVAAISGAGSMSELSGTPDIDLAKTYLGKYPAGKYIKKVYAILATFYQNLYEELEDEKSASIVYCFNEYLTVHPEDKDRELVRKKALDYYKELLAMESEPPEEYKKAINNLENKRDGNIRYWCTD